MKKLKNLFKSKKRKEAEAAELQAQFELAQKYLKAIEEAQVEKSKKPVAKKPVAKKPTVATEKPVAKKPATKKK